MPSSPFGPVSIRFVRSSGPGGQNVNKVATAVELRFDVMAARLPEDAKARLRRFAGHRLLDGDVLLIDAREHRTQGKNREAAYARLAELIARALVRPRPRRRTRAPATVREARVDAKTRRGAIKRRRSKPPRSEE